MKVSKELSDRMKHALVCNGSVRKAAFSYGLKWWTLYDAMTRPQVMRDYRLMQVYRAFDVEPKKAKVYWRPAVSLEMKQSVTEFLQENPEVSIEDLLALGMEAAVTYDLEESDALASIAWAGTL